MTPGRAPGRGSSIVLIGMMGSGKTAVGRALAGKLGCQRVDTDEMVELEAGMTVAQIFASRGERAFRAAEAKAVENVRGMQGPLVASLGGGAVLEAGNRALVRELAPVVWLRATPSTLARRIGSGRSRPLLQARAGLTSGSGSDPGGTGAEGQVDRLARLARLAEEREPIYAELADAVVDVDRLSAEQVADQIVALLQERDRERQH